ncbi:MAG: hypothetical protein ACFFCW_11605 [Candidatus Hodarchaeota archaeon]
MYYKEFEKPPVGVHFSQEWGFQDSWPIQGTDGDWKEYTFEYVTEVIYQRAASQNYRFAKEILTLSITCINV